MPQQDIIPTPDRAANKAIELLKTYEKEVEVFVSRALSAATAAQEASNNAEICAANAANAVEQYGKSDNASAGVQVPNKDNKNEIYEYIEKQATAASEHSKEASVAVNNISDYIEKVNSILKMVDNRNRSFNTNYVIGIKMQAIKKIGESLDIMSQYQKQTETNAKKTQNYANQANKYFFIVNNSYVSTYRDFVTTFEKTKDTFIDLEKTAQSIYKTSDNLKKKYTEYDMPIKHYNINSIILSIQTILAAILNNIIFYTSEIKRYTIFKNEPRGNTNEDITPLIIQYDKDYNKYIVIVHNIIKELNRLLCQIINNTLDFVINNYKNMITKIGDNNKSLYNAIIEKNKKDLDLIFTSESLLNNSEFQNVINKTAAKYKVYEKLKEELMAAAAPAVLGLGADGAAISTPVANGDGVHVHVPGVDDPAASVASPPGSGVDDAASDAVSDAASADDLDVPADDVDVPVAPDDPDDPSSADGAAAAEKKEALNNNIAIYINQAYDETKFNLPEQINIDPNTFGDNSISLPLDYCVEYPTIKNDDFSKNGKTFTFYRMLINQAGFQKYFINDVIKTSVIHITLTNISENDDTHLLSIRLKDMKNIQTSLLQKIKNGIGISNENKISLKNMRKAITFFVGMKDGKVNFSNINKFRSVTKSGNSNSFSDPKLKFKNIKYILFLGKLQTEEEEDGDNYTTTYNAVYFNISKVIYIYSENIPNTDCFEKVKAETDIFSKKILYCLYNIDYITFTGNYLNYILQELKLKLKGGNKYEPRPVPPNSNSKVVPHNALLGGNNQIDVINNLEVNNNNKDFKEVHEEDVIISDKIIKKKGNKIQKKLTKTKKVPEKAYDIAKEKAPKKAPKKLLIDFS